MPASQERQSRLNVLGRYGVARSLTSASDDRTARPCHPQQRLTWGELWDRRSWSPFHQIIRVITPIMVADRWRPTRRCQVRKLTSIRPQPEICNCGALSQAGWRVECGGLNKFQVRLGKLQ